MRYDRFEILLKNSYIQLLCITYLNHEIEHLNILRNYDYNYKNYWIMLGAHDLEHYTLLK